MGEGLFHRHRWTDWVIVDRGQVLHHGSPVGWYAVQERYCQTCGKTQVDDQANYGGHRSIWCDRRSTMTKRAPRKDGVTA